MLIFISAIEPEKDITEYIREWTNNFKWFYYPRGFKEDPYEVVINDLRILNEAFIYSLRLRSLALIEYILNSCQNLYINPSVTEKHISPLLVDHEDENVQKILRFIVTKDIIIVNDGSLKLEESFEEVSDLDKSNDMMFVSTDRSKFLNFKGGNHKNHDNGFEKSLNNSKTIAEITDPVLFKTK